MTSTCDTHDKKISKFLPILLLIVLGFIAYGNSLRGEFIYDDISLIKYNDGVKNWRGLLNVLEEYMGGGTTSTFYRPVQMISYIADYSLWGLNAIGYHLTNVILHILVSLCIYWMLTLLFEKTAFALLASMLYSVHPIHTEAVAYISGRADSLAALFILLCLIFYIKQISSESETNFILILLSYLFALLSKELSVITPLLVLLYSYVFKKSLRAKEFLSLVLITVIYVTTKIVLLRHFPLLQYPLSFLVRLPGFFVALVEYLRLLVLPFNLHMAYGNKMFSFSDPRALVGFIIVLLLSACIFMKPKRDKVTVFSISWFFLTLLPQSNLYPMKAFMAEHWLYLPSIGFFLMLAKGLISLYDGRGTKNIALILIMGILFSYVCLTIKQNNYWKEPVFFYQRTLQYAPNNWELCYNLAVNYANNGNYQDAVVVYTKVLKINPGEINTHCNLSALYHLLGKNEEAVDLLRKAIEIDPNDARLYYLLGNLYNSIGKEEEAMAAYKKSITINPNYVLAYNGLGKIIYKKSGDKKEAAMLFNKAIAMLNEAVRLESDLAIAHNNLAEAYYYTKQYDFAIRHCDKAIELGYKVDPELLNLLTPYRK